MQNQKIPMTSPVLMVYQNMNNELINTNSNVDVSMRFYVPKAQQDNTPVPKENGLFIKSEP